MPVQYIKRLQMAFDFWKTVLPDPDLQEHFDFVPWDTSLLEIHADVKHRSFRNDSDADIFPTFREYDRCYQLMNAIVGSSSFLPTATVLISFQSEPGVYEYVASIQGMRLSERIGAIQNVAVVPDFRKRGLGRALVLRSLGGFRAAGVNRVTLEVTADNIPAVRLYHGVGFATFKSYFREIYVK